MKLSIVSTLYSSARYVAEFHQRIIRVAEPLTDDIELIFVNDGSPDDSLDIAIAIAERDPRVRVVDLSRNYGHHRAMLTGLGYATGDRVFLIDVDLEESPETLKAFWEKMEATPDADVVYGVQENKNTPWPRRALSELFYIIFNAVSYVKIPSKELVSRLMTRRYLQGLLSYAEREIFLPALWVDAGFKQVPIEVQKGFDGSTSYTLAGRIKLAVEAITSFSVRPLVFIFYAGTTLSAASFLWICYLVVRKLFLDEPLLGWTSTMASIYLVGGLVLFALGIIGVYLSRIFLEVKQRPYPIVRRVYSQGGDET